jgi:hypothetical protein
MLGNIWPGSQFGAGLLLENENLECGDHKTVFDLHNGV